MSSLEELKKLPQWVAYQMFWSEEQKRFDKPPINPKTGKIADVKDASTWGTYDFALDYALRTNSGGVGFVFTDGDCYAGIDLDHVIDDAGNLKDYAAEIVATMNSYTELSPSGDGLHILFKLSVPLSEIGFFRKNKEPKIEIYDSERYFTITEKVYGEMKPISERTSELREVYKKYMTNPSEDEKLRAFLLSWIKKIFL